MKFIYDSKPVFKKISLTNNSAEERFLWQAEETSFEQELFLKLVLTIRRRHPILGGRKLLTLLEPYLLEHQIKMARDALFELVAAHHLLIKRRKRRIYTTNSLHWLRRYPNLIRDYIPTKHNQLSVSDITNWRLKDRFINISFITDAYSYKIVGYQVDQTLEAASTIRALQMAIEKAVGSLAGLIHHSDRGIQYCSHNYVKLLQDNEIQISMTENRDPMENAFAEIVNGIINRGIWTVTMYAQPKRHLSY